MGFEMSEEKTEDESMLDVRWLDGKRYAQSPTNPQFPDGMAIDMSRGASATCTVELPYPAKRCGMYTVDCRTCGIHIALTTAGRRDDPRTVKIGCKAQA